MPGPAAIGKIVRTREAAGTMTATMTATMAGATAGTTTTETACCLLSAALSGERLSEGVRSHRGIENRLHYRLDAVINEDQARSQSGHGPQNLAILRRMARNGTQKDTAKGSPRGKFKRAGWDDKYLASLIALFWNGVALLSPAKGLAINDSQA